MSENASPTSSTLFDNGGEGRSAPALDYSAFRRMADWAAGMLDERVVFDYEPSGALLANAPVGVRPPALRVPAVTVGRARAVQTLNLSAPKGEALNLARGSDAAFWSEAAVEKFLLPYFASLAGGRAAPLMAQLMGVWAGTTNNTTKDSTQDLQVLALTHAAHPPEPGATGVLDTLGVVYTQGDDPPERVPLSTFLRDHRPDLLRPTLSVANPAPPAPRDLARPGANLDALPFPPRYLELRVMAEWASSRRGAESSYFTCDTRAIPDPADPYRRIRVSDTAPRNAHGIVIPAYTEPLVAKRPRPRAVEIAPRLAPRKVKDLAGEADAVFWGTGAVEHLLMPYYAQVYGGQALRQIQAIHHVWWRYGVDPRPHAPTEGEGAEPLAGLKVYALAHLPYSDWTTETMRAMGDSTGVVFTDEQDPDEPKLMTLREFLAKVPL